MSYRVMSATFSGKNDLWLKLEADEREINNALFQNMTMQNCCQVKELRFHQYPV